MELNLIEAACNNKSLQRKIKKRSMDLEKTKIKKVKRQLSFSQSLELENPVEYEIKVSITKSCMRKILYGFLFVSYS